MATETIYQSVRRLVSREALAPPVAARRALEGMTKAQLIEFVLPEVAAWVKATPGLGEESMARLLGRIGHPVIARPHRWMDEAPEGHKCGNTCGEDRHLVALEPFERSVSQLWSYCGHGDPGRRKRKGMTADEATALGSPQAKMLTHLIAECAMRCNGSSPIREPGPMPDVGANGTDGASVESKPTAPERRRSPYRDTYDQRKAVTADRDDWTQAHKHADALRITGKAILRDLWVVASQSRYVARLVAGDPAGGES